MFGNREFAVRMRKAEAGKDNNEPREEVDWDTKVATAIYVTKTAAYHAAVGVCAYILLDTYRQVKVAQNTNATER